MQFENLLDTESLVIIQCGHINNLHSNLIEINSNIFQEISSNSFNVFLFPKMQFNKRIKIIIRKNPYFPIRAYFSPGYFKNGYYELNNNNSIYKEDIDNVTYIGTNLYYDIGNIRNISKITFSY